MSSMLIKRFDFFLVCLLIAAVGVAQTVTLARPAPVAQASCPAIVQQAFDTTGAQCTRAGRNKMCYGNPSVTADFQSGSAPVNFQAPGDLVDVTQLKAITLSPMDSVTNSWGVAEMKIQADLPNTNPNQNVTLVLFGQVQLSDAAPDANATVTALTPTVPAAQQTQHAASATAVAVRQMTREAATATKLGAMIDTATAKAATPAPAATLPASKLTQVAATATRLANWIDTATAAPATSASLSNGPYRPMQAFYFQSGDSAPCQQAPYNGILIQSPQGAQRVTLLVDGVTIRLGSTVFLQAQPSRFLTVNVLEGSVQVATAGQVQVAGPGLAIQVPLDANLNAVGAPRPAQAYLADTVRALPIRLLPNPISAAPGLLTGNTPTGQPVNVTAEGAVQASSTFPGYPASLAVDGDPTTSWFSTGPGPGGTPSTFRWTGKRDDRIDSITVQSNRLNSNPAFRTGYGFGSVTIQVLDGSQNVVYATTVDLPGTPDPDVTVSPQVVGRSVVLILAGHEAPNCGGFAELTIIARR